MLYFFVCSKVCEDILFCLILLTDVFFKVIIEFFSIMHSCYINKHTCVNCTSNAIYVLAAL